MKNRYLNFTFIFASIVFCSALAAEALSKEPCASVAFLKPTNPSSFPKAIIHFDNFPKNQEITWFIHRLVAGNKKSMPTFRINDQDRILTSDNQEFGVIEIPPLGFLPGERIRATFQTKSGETISRVTFIPFMMVSEIPEANLGLMAELVCVKPTENYELNIIGLQEGEKFVFESKSASETIKRELLYTEKNQLAIMPAVIGQKGGVATINIITQKGTLSLQLPWGIALVASMLEPFKSELIE